MAVEDGSVPVELDWLQAREIAIQQAIDSGDLAGLRAWSKDIGGFGSSAIRRKAWPFLLGVTHLHPVSEQDSLVDSKEAEDESVEETDHDQTADSVVDVAALIEEDLADKRQADAEVPSKSAAGQDEQPIEHHPDERQVGLDTQRSFVYYPPDLHASEKKRLQDALNEIIVTVLRKRKGLSYFQGYHDIISVLYLTFLPYTPPQRSRSTSRSSSRTRATARARERHASRSRSRGASRSPLSVPSTEEATRIAGRRASGPSEDGQSNTRQRSQDLPEWQVLLDCCDAVSLLRIRDGMTKGLAPVIGYLRLFKRILKAADPELAELVLATSPTPYFALSWLLTLFSHDINTLEPVQRIFDFLLARNPAAVIYLGVAIVLLKKDRIMKLASTLEDDPGIIHTNLALLPPLMADNPGDPPRMKSTIEAARLAALEPLEDSTIYPTTDGPNPHEPIVLSELFALTDSLWLRFPLQHAAVRADEIMASRSAIFTYRDLESTLETGSVNADGTKIRSMNATDDIAAWIATGPLNEAEVVVVPSLDDSDDEKPLDVPAHAIRKSFNRKSDLLKRRWVGRTSLAIIVLLLGLSIAAYQARTKRGLPGLWAFPGLFLDFGMVESLRGRLGLVGAWLVAGRMKLSEVTAGAKHYAQSLSY
ncbi:hypothetical protein QFC21_004889 [Naganishia friedmannii]|uniref:Uncharacterized protein n=1 Tax=Naganishia friedmannii TaxID=89922 RepID=A0ACC2VDQ0_9TREE|nr:hypothetical protein QFC21_004889 [Naganishia friedmannii]